MAENIEETFKKAASHLQNLISTLSSDQLLNFYGLYKQATCGTCNEPSPGWYQVQARQKWQAWKNIGNMNKEEAMLNYINCIENIDPKWYDSEESKQSYWISVSKPQNMDVELKDIDKKLLDWVKDCNEEMVKSVLSHNKSEIVLKDENGMLPIHWASDRGNIGIMKYLIESGSDINGLDSEGQTPLHYAASCGHEDAVKLLLSMNANIVEDNYGLSPKNVAADKTISSMF